MSKPTQTALLTVLLALLPLVGNAQTCQTASISATTPSSQLTDNGNGTVTDAKTGLMWKQCSEGRSGAGCAIGTAQTYTWQAAWAQARTVNTGGGFEGHTDWRLPNIKELRSIVERQCFLPAINLTRFPNTDQNVVFWSASPDAVNGYYVWGTDFSYGHYDMCFKHHAFQLRLVRSGQ